MRIISNLKIGKRLGLGFSVMLLLIGGMAATGFLGAAKLFAEVKTIYEDRTVPLGELATINKLMMSNRVLVKDAMLDPNTLAQNQALIQTNAARIGQVWDRYMTSRHTPEEAQLAAAYSPARAAFVKDG